jgi:Tfp pilus assembly protein PilO
MYMNYIRQQLKGFNSRTFYLLGMLFGSMLISLYFNHIFKPSQRKLVSLRKEMVEINKKLLKVKTDIPATADLKAKLDSQEKQILADKKSFRKYEMKLPDKESLPLILKTIFVQTVGYDVDFQYVMPVPEKKDETHLFESLQIKLSFFARYYDVVQYLRRLEGALPFIKIVQVNVKKLDPDESPDTEKREVLLVLRTLFSPHKRAQDLFVEDAKRVEPLQLDQERDVFVSRLKSEEKPQEEKVYTLTGVVLNGLKSTAIIDDEVYRIGDAIDNGIVKEIKPDAVVLAFGANMVHLIVQKQ